tara:strand:- start:125 stop:991 length:867 start_codon:yes stop_codon:yes gene_type:complete
MNNLIKEYLQLYLQKVVSGEADISPVSIAFFKRECARALSKQFTGSARRWSMRMSALGKPLCQQQLERDGVETKTELEYNSVNRFLFGDILEALIYVQLKEAGVNVQGYQKPVRLELEGVMLQGTLDIIIDGAVWDIKTSSPYAFTSKFTNYKRVKDNDPFGYVVQGHLYGAAENKPFGGWIVINKSSGEIQICSAPSIQDEEREAALNTAAHNIRILKDTTVPLQKLEDIPEKYKGTPTGNRLMNTTCSFCRFKSHCWPKAKLHHKVSSDAKNPPLVWYSVLKNEQI